jgi:hypothetical protein
MRARRIPGLSLLACMGLAACADQAPELIDSKLREATAIAVNGLDPASVTITNVEKSTIKVSWRATAGEAAYDCNADNLYRLPACEPAS